MQAGFPGQFNELVAFFHVRRQGLCGKHVLPVQKRLLGHLVMLVGPGDVQHDVHLGIREDGPCVRREHPLGDDDAAVRRDVEVRNLLKYDVDAEALRHDVAMLEETVRNSRADGPEAEYSNSDLLHQVTFFLHEPYILHFYVPIRQLEALGIFGLFGHSMRQVYTKKRRRARRRLFSRPGGRLG